MRGNMTRNRRSLLVGLSLLMAPLMAYSGDLTAREALTPSHLQAPLPGSAGEAAFLKAQAPVMESLLRSEGELRAQERAVLAGYFAEASRAYPALPGGVLEAIAFVGSRWIHRQPEGLVSGHHNMPQTAGVMGLHQGAGHFRNVQAEAAAAGGFSLEQLRQDPRAQILSTAALLNQYLQEQNSDRRGAGPATLEDLVPALERLSGLPTTGAVHRFARLSYAYDILLTLDRGVDDWGMRVPRHSIDWGMAFSREELAYLRAPVVRVDVEADRVSLPDALDTRAPGLLDSERGLSGNDAHKEAAMTPTTTDYAPALWVASPNYSSRSGTKITHIAIHTVQGSYSSCISWFQNPDANASAHYVVRSSDGQVTQMVLESNKAWHVGSENPYTLGTEHEGYVDTSSYYTTAMYNSSSALSKDMCKSNAIDCTTCYPGPAHSDVSVQSQSYKVKGHQHYPNQTHNDPGIYWDWSKYKGLLGGTTTPPTSTTTVLDSFETGEGHFNTAPTYSGSTTGIATTSTADRSTTKKKNGSYAEALVLKDNTSSTAAWEVRFLSGSGDPAQNTALAKAGGKVGFWVFTSTSGISAALGMDDTDGTERSTKKTITANTWTFLEWKLDDQAQWDAWSGGNGVLDNTTSLKLDAIWFFRANSSTSATIYVDDVTYTK